MKLLKEKYKTWEGAHRRCAFENALAKGEFNRGNKAKLYRYTLECEKDENGVETYRVARHVA